MRFVMEKGRIGVRGMPLPHGHFLIGPSQTMRWVLSLSPPYAGGNRSSEQSMTYLRSHSEGVKGCSCEDGDCGFCGVCLGSVVRETRVSLWTLLRNRMSFLLLL